MNSSRAARLLLPIIYLGFISLGLPDGTFGVAWPQAHKSLQVPIGVAGIIVLIITVLAATSGFSSGAVNRRFRTPIVVFVSCLLTSSGLLIVSRAPTFTWVLIAAIPLGLGAGAVDASLNGYVARHYTGRQMNWLHACWGVGATCGPLIIAQAMRHSDGWRGGYLMLGGIQMTLAVLFLSTLRWWDAVPERANGFQRAEQSGATPPRAAANSAAGWLSAGIFALYVGVETTAGLWASSILVEARGFPVAVAGVCASAYYASITGGRILVGFVVDRWGNRRLVALGGALALLAGALFTFGGGVPLAVASLVLLGLGFAPIYPGLMHEVPRRFAPEAVQTVIGRQSGAANIGGAVLPTIAGSLAGVSLESITWLICGSIVALIAAVRRLDRIT